MFGVATHLFDETKPVQPQHVDIGDDDIGRLLLQNLESVHPVLRLDDAIASTGQRQQQHVAHGARIIDREDRLAH